MPTQRYARIAITLPRDTLVSADRLAHAQDRPRSWIVAEAIRAYAVSHPNDPPATRRPVPAGIGLGESRLAQLVADLRLTPVERVRVAEETARATASRHAGARLRLVSFERYEDYLQWKRVDDAVG